MLLVRIFICIEERRRGVFCWRGLKGFEEDWGMVLGGYTRICFGFLVGEEFVEGGGG